MLLIAELLSRVLVDPVYFWQIDTYNSKDNNPNDSFIGKYKQRIAGKQTRHADYLFIGTSRVPATINSSVFQSFDPDKIIVVAGRGYLTPGIHYQALKNRLSRYPDFLRGTIVFLEYPGTTVYSETFAADEMTVFEPDMPGEKPMPHLLIPHLDHRSVIRFLKKSNNSPRVKAGVVLSYCSSFYRTSPFIKEKVQRLDEFVQKNQENLIAGEGGIRNDNLEAAKEKALYYSKELKEISEESPMLTSSQLDSSTLAMFYKIIHDNGGQLLLYRMPLHSVQKNIYNSVKEQHNQAVFSDWLEERQIKVLNLAGFKYSDSDFPDIWHLSKTRRDEFTTRLYEDLKSTLVEEKAKSLGFMRPEAGANLKH